jgi:hypothetical protein
MDIVLSPSIRFSGSLREILARADAPATRTLPETPLILSNTPTDARCATYTSSVQPDSRPSTARRQITLLVLCQALLYVNNVTLITINGLAGLALAPSPLWATLPVTTYIVGSALTTVPASIIPAVDMNMPLRERSSTRPWITMPSDRQRALTRTGTRTASRWSM